MSKRWMCVSMILGALVLPAAAETDEDKGPTAAEQVAIAEALRPSLVQVEFTLQMDKGQPPHAGWLQRWTGYGQYPASGVAQVVEEERPFEAPGFVLSPTEILTPDPMIHPRFVKSIAVRYGDKTVAATPARYGANQTAMVLKLAEPLEGIRPLQFDVKLEPPFQVVTYSLADGDWTVGVKGLPTQVGVAATGRKFRTVPPCCLIVDRTGKPVGMSMNDQLPIDDSWRGSPTRWEMVAAEDLAKAVETLKARFAAGVVRVALSFRSPKKGAEQSYSRYGPYGAGEDAGTEQNVLGAVIDADRVLVLASLTPKVTARLERITVHRPAAKPIAAKFVHSLKDYGAFIAKLEAPIEGAVSPSDQPITAWRNKLLLAAEVELQGEKCTTYFSHHRVGGFGLGYKRRLFPQVRTDDKNVVLFDREANLVAFPLIRRPKAGQQQTWRSEYPTMTPVGHVTSFLFGDMAAHIDVSNVPLTEEEEARLAWLGVELQKLDRELARINKVSHLTRDGATGGMVSYVYDGSPAAAAGIRPGDILLRLHAPEQPKPIEIEADEAMFGGRDFPWDRYDDLPEQYFDRIPRPWPPAENGLNRVLTDLGFGKTFEAQFARDGEVFRKPFEVVQSPAHYDMAPKYKSEPLGVTVHDLTFEVRRYFLRRAEDPGVILARIEPGSKASVAGMKPYEIVTHVNNEPVMNVADFQRLVAQPGDLELSIKRMTKGRVVRIRRDKPAASRPATDESAEAAPAEQPHHSGTTVSIVR